MANLQKLVRDLQPSESRRFQNVESIDATATKNPLGLRWANIERAFHGAASKIVGWSFDETLKSFLDTPAIDRIVFCQWIPRGLIFALQRIENDSGLGIVPSGACLRKRGENTPWRLDTVATVVVEEIVTTCLSIFNMLFCNPTLLNPR